MSNREFSVWAPKAQKVTLVIGNVEIAMQKDKDGYWKVFVETGSKNRKYGYKIDGKGPFPDPRSNFQPDGIHGLSQDFHADFSWHDADFLPTPLKNALIYEIHVGTFSEAGTFAGAAEKIDHLKGLGVTHVELMPIASFPGHHGWGYDGVSLFSPHSAYGSPEDLKMLVDKCHENGLAVILDVVYNHLGPDGNYLGLYGHYFSHRYHTPWGAAVNFDDANSDEVRRFFIDNALYWLREYHFDGLRLDAVHAIFDFSATHILEELQLRVEELGRQTGRELFLIAESDLNDPRLLYSREQGGYGLAAQWLDDFHHAVHVLLTGEQQGYYCDFSGFADLQKCLEQKYVYAGNFSKHRKRRHGRMPIGLGYERFVVSLQNHDQIGNRALGERISHLTDFARCQAAAAMLLLSPFVPMLFQGEEWAASSPFLYFTDHVDKNLAEAVREGRRKEFPFINAEVPDPQTEETFLRSKLNWTEIRQTKHKQMFEWYRALIKIRKKNHEQLRNARPVLSLISDQSNLVQYQAGNLCLIANMGEGAAQLPIFAAKKILLCNNNVQIKQDCMILPEGASVIFKGSNQFNQGVKT
jgi:maltooligosyltrehalose trehalohydrolase